MKLTFCGKSPQQRFFRIGVVGNNLADDPTVLANWVWLRTPDCKVLSVNSKTGAVVLTTSDIAEGSNLYFTEARATANFNSNFKNKSVTKLKDGANVVLSTDTLTINGGKA